MVDERGRLPFDPDNIGFIVRWSYGLSQHCGYSLVKSVGLLMNDYYMRPAKPIHHLLSRSPPTIRQFDSIDMALDGHLSAWAVLFDEFPPSRSLDAEEQRRFRQMLKVEISSYQPPERDTLLGILYPL